MRKAMNKSNGFSLIELLIVIVIVGVLLSISVPAYQNYIQESRRADAHAALLDIAARQERFVAQNNTYTTEISGAAGLGLGRATSAEGYYNMGVAACNGGTIATCYVITATGVGSQAQDSDCTTITYDSAGTKSGATDDCW
jgi:type IV pilus assembly protein PilE